MSDSSDCDSSPSADEQSEAIQQSQQTQKAREKTSNKPIVSRRRRSYYKHWDGLTDAGKISRLYGERKALKAKLLSINNVINRRNEPKRVGLNPVIVETNNHDYGVLSASSSSDGDKSLPAESSSSGGDEAIRSSYSSGSNESLDLLNISCGVTQCSSYGDLDKDLIVPSENSLITE